jgi:hypothetical protein
MLVQSGLGIRANRMSILRYAEEGAPQYSSAFSQAEHSTFGRRAGNALCWSALATNEKSGFGAGKVTEAGSNQ